MTGNLSCLGAIVRRSGYPFSSLNYSIASLNCTGDEDSIFSCFYIMMNSGHSRTCNYEAGIICQGNTVSLQAVRL